MNNTVKTTVLNTSPASTAITNENAYASYNTMSGTCPLSNKYVLFGGREYSFIGGVFDLSTSSVVAVRREYVAYVAYNSSRAKHPILDNDVPCLVYANRLWTMTAISSLVLPEAKVKTASTGMTATYELEVYW